MVFRFCINVIVTYYNLKEILFFITGTDGERLVQIKQKIQINWN